MRYFILGLILISCATPALAGLEQPVGFWLQQTKQEAVSKGVSPELFDTVFPPSKGFTPIQRIIDLDRKQPEGTKTFTTYLTQVVPGSRVNEGRRRYAENKPLIDRIAQKYGVPGQYIVALWGIETNYGTNTGGFNVPIALATLAYEGRRADFFKDELIKSLLIIQQGHITYGQMKGSWAGAMGQCQFMPSSFFNFAVDESGDGHKDIWNTQADVFASIANYLSKSGWNNQISWGREVKVPRGFDEKLADIAVFRPVAEYQKMGVTLPHGAALPNEATEYALMFPGQSYEGAYLITRNYPVILKWNRSRYFATAVGTLADRIAGK